MYDPERTNSAEDETCQGERTFSLSLLDLPIEVSEKKVIFLTFDHLKIIKTNFQFGKVSFIYFEIFYKYHSFLLKWG